MAPCWVLKEQPVVVGSSRRLLPGMTWSRKPDPCGFRCGMWWVVGWSLVENCTVDASIFVVKLSRANGGCLGTRSR